MKFSSLHSYIRRAIQYKRTEVNKTKSFSYTTYVIKEFLIRLGKSIGILSVPVVFIDVIGYPASIIGSSMEHGWPSGLRRQTQANNMYASHENSV
ncbi:hypothetical protein QQG55_9255 [Brugia pahangi]